MNQELVQASRNYQLVEQSLQYIHDHRLEQPSLDEVARAMELSPFHFQRVFQQWAGVSPKRFLQFLGREHAKDLLRRNHSVLDAAHASGHSGPGRLHDLFVRTEAITPGDYRRAGEGLRIEWGLHPSPFGMCFIALTQRGVCAMAFVADDTELEIVKTRTRQHDFPRAEFVEAPEPTARMVARIFTHTPPRRQTDRRTPPRHRIPAPCLASPSRNPPG